MKTYKLILIFILCVALILGGYFVYNWFHLKIIRSQQSGSFFLTGKEFEALISDHPILMYHHIIENQDPENLLEKSLDVSPTNFDEQMAYLSSRGYQTIFLDDLFSDKTDKKFIITIDDGYKDIIVNGYPILEKYNFKATIFLIYNKIGQNGYMDWNDIYFLKNKGWEIGSHSLNHSNLTAIPQEKAEKEISESKELLGKKLDQIIRYFCYPSSLYNEEIENLVEEAGYDEAVTTEEGKNNLYTKRYELKRIRISGPDSLKKFVEKVEETKE